ncbi:MAG: MBL fold metallo-hydrolase [Oscillospiraceae bacterium]|nr:MBL fold metallo-hydrolase [Oscillospiraceae bacterium]
MIENENWFISEQIDENTFVISENQHWEETHCYLLCGKQRAVLIDTGLGVCNIYEEAHKLTEKPIIAVPTHIHWDHIGGLWHFPEFYVHEEEKDWINGKFPLPVEIVRKELVKCNTLPCEFEADSYAIFQGKPSALLEDCAEIDLGERIIKVLHTPGHSPGHICLWEEKTGYLFTGDLAYKGTLFANYPSTDPTAYLKSLEKVAGLSAKKIFPAHHSLDIEPEILIRMHDELRALNEKGLLRHGSGKFSFNDWEILL